MYTYSLTLFVRRGILCIRILAPCYIQRIHILAPYIYYQTLMLLCSLLCSAGCENLLKSMHTYSRTLLQSMYTYSHTLRLPRQVYVYVFSETSLCIRILTPCYSVYIHILAPYLYGMERVRFCSRVHSAGCQKWQ